MTPARESQAKTWALATTLLTALAGGGALALARVPAGWLSGAMLAVAVLAALGRAAIFPTPLRQFAIALTGVGMGSGLTPATLHTLARYPLSLLLMAFALAGMTAASYLVLTRAPGVSRRTAFYSAVPGALSYVFIVAEPAGADMARLAVIQLFRIFVLMAIVPIVARIGVTIPAIAYAVDPIADTLVMLGLAWAVGAWLERRGLSSGTLYTAIVVSGLAHATGWAPGRFAPGAQVLAQTLIGAWVGARFVGFDWELLHRSLIAAATSFLAAFAVAAAFAWTAAYAVNLPFAETLVAFAPGGLEAMTMMAFALGLDPLYVGAHHLARFVLIGFALPFAARRIGGASADSLTPARPPAP